MTNNRLATLVIRITLGISFLFHGINRIYSGVGEFSKNMVVKFADSSLPEIVILPFSYLMPFLWIVIGILILLKLRIKQVLVAAFIFSNLIIIGICVVGQWGALSIQFFHILMIYILLKDDLLFKAKN